MSMFLLRLALLMMMLLIIGELSTALADGLISILRHDALLYGAPPEMG